MARFNRTLIGGSIMLLITFNIFNALNFIYQITMARMLTLAEYGILSTLFAILYILNTFSESIQVVITKYSAEESDSGKLKNIIKRAGRKALVVSSVLFALYLILSIFLAGLFKIGYPLLALNGIMIFAFFFAPLTRGVMQGRKMFTALGINVVIDASCRLIIGVLLVTLGFKIYGAVTAILLGAFIGIIFSLIPLRGLLKSEEKEARTPGIYNYTKPVIFITTIIVIFFSIDVMIAKIFFSEEIAGAYAVSSILAKAIFMGVNPISKAMFPLSASENSQKERRRNVFFNALAFLSLIIIVCLAVYYLFPHILVRIFSGEYIQESISIVFLVAVAISLVSIANLVLLYKLSQGNVKNYVYLALAIVIEIILLSYFSSNLVQFSWAFIASSAIFLLGSLLLPK